MERNLRAWQKDFIDGSFENNDFKTQCEAGWYDWFCKDTSLAAKTKRMGNIIKQVKEGGKVDIDNQYVWFKNNCPLSGPLYDDFRFADMKTSTTLMTVQIDCCWNKSKYTVFARRTANEEMDCEHPAFKTDSLRELVKWFNTPWDN